MNRCHVCFIGAICLAMSRITFDNVSNGNRNKPTNQLPHGLLQPLEIPDIVGNLLLLISLLVYQNQMVLMLL